MKNIKKNNLMSYKGYNGSFYFDLEEKLFFGKIEFIRDLVSYEARDADNLIKVFYEAVDDYLEDCQITGKKPDQPFKGSFNIRIEPELHREIGLYALNHGSSLNGVVKDALHRFIENP